MGERFTESEIDSIERDIRRKYDKVAVTPEGQFRYPVGLEALRALGYDMRLIDRLPLEAARSYCGSGNPLSLGPISPGENILDFGCGAGVDTILAGYLAGDEGRVIGIDVVPSMLKRARANASISSVSNTEFFLSEEYPMDEARESFDVIISNSVLNLVPEKEELLSTFYSLLKPGGRLHMVDQIFTGAAIKEHRERVESWFQ